MKLLDIAFAVVAVVLWGFAFPAIKIGLDSFSPAQMTALRFLVAASPVLFLSRPGIPWRTLILIGMTLFAGQFLLLFFAYTQGMSPGVASVVMQIQAFFTVLIAAVTLGDTPTVRQMAAMGVAFVGLAMIGLTVGTDLTLLGLSLTLAAAFSWAVGNVMVKRTTHVPMLPLMVWLSLVPPLPALLVSSVFDERSLVKALADASWASLGAAFYLGAMATTVAYALWGDLLRRYSTAVVAPFALLAPCVGVVTSAIMFNEQFGPLRYAGMILILAGLAVIVLPIGRARLGVTREI